MDPQTGLNVIQKESGEFLSGWKLSEEQLKHVLKTGQARGRLMNAVHQDYVSLMNAFVSGAISAPEFERQYLEKFKNERRPLDEWTYRILDEVFGHVDAFTADEALYQQVSDENPGWPLTEAQLKKKVREAAARLSA